MPGVFSSALLPLLVAVWEAAAQDGFPPEAAAAVGALGTDDECQAGDVDRCGLSAMQLRRQSLAGRSGGDAENKTEPAGPYEQCGGKDYAGTTECITGYACFNDSLYWSMCRPRKFLDVPWKPYNGSKVLNTTSVAPLLTFYVYRAVDMGTYPPTNANLGSIGGLLLWLANNVVTCQTCPIVRPHGIDRIARYKVQTKATRPLFTAGMSFGLAMHFEDGLCEGPCDEMFAKYGYYVGCKNLSSDMSGVMYSFPGQCAGLKRELKSMECKRGQPGGFCEGAPTGNGTCTWTYEEAGEVSLNELEGITNYTAFKESGGEEYVQSLDKGINMTFWDGIVNAKAHAARVEKLDALFKKDFPDLPSEDELPAPPCSLELKMFLA